MWKMRWASTPRGASRVTMGMPLAVAIVALAVQMVYLAEGGKDPTFDQPIVDAGTYHTAATRFATGGPLSRDAFWQPPFFPLVLGCIYRVVGDSILVAKILFAFVGAMSCVLVWRLASMLFDRRVATIAGLMLAFYGPFVFFSTQLLPTGLAILLNLLALALWVRCLDQPRWYRWLLFGLMVGAATITVPNSAVLLILAVIWGVAFRHAQIGDTRRGRAWSGCALVTAGAALPIGVVALHNYVVSHEWVLISTNGGINFYVGNNPRADETIAIRPGEYWRRLARESFNDEPRTRAAQSSFFFKKTLRYAADQPTDFLRGLVRKARRLVNAREIPRNVDPYVYRDFSYLLSVLMWRARSFAFPFGLVAPFAAVGIVISIAEGREKLRGRLALMAFILAYGGSVVLFFVSSRYRLPIIPVILIFAAAGVVWLGRQMGRRPGALVRPRLRYVAAAVFALMAVLVNTPVATPTDPVDFEVELHLCVGDAYMRQERLDEAAEHLRQAVRIDPRFAGAYGKLGHIMALRGAFAEAERLFDRALALDADSSEARALLGHLLHAQGRTVEAAEALHQALTMDPFSPEAHRGLADLLVETGELEEAIDHYRKAVRFTDEPGEVLIRLADALAQEGAYEEAIERYRQALWHIEPDPATLNRIAWLLATCPQAEWRDCTQAISIAEHLCKMTEYEQPVALDTLAAAYAECGRIEDAIFWVQRAIDLAISSGDTEAAQSFRTRLEIYRRKSSG